MINSNIIKIASITKNVGLKKNYTHKSSLKNSMCGDFIEAEFILDKSKVISMRYETDSCILCEASASLFSRKIKNYKIQEAKKEIKKLIDIKKSENCVFPHKYREFNQLISKKNISRLNCVILPMEAFLKAFNVKK